MLLALWWAVGEATGLAHPSLSWMAATHGVANALGFVLCTLLGLRLAAERPRADRADVRRGRRDAGGSAPGGLPAPAGAAPADCRARPRTTSRAVGDALLRWRVHEAAGVEVLPGRSDEAAPGVRVVSRLGVGPVQLSEPCEVVWVERTADRVGFGYGTLPGHLFRGRGGVHDRARRRRGTCGSS